MDLFNNSLFNLLPSPPLNTPPKHSKPRLKKPVRDQVEMRLAALDDLLPDDHKARFVWDFVKQLNLSEILTKIKSIENNPGRPATDPHIHLSLWLLATIEGIGSARMIERYSREHIAFQWICGGVAVNHHTIADFRIDHGQELDNLLTESIAILMKSGLVTLNRVSQDGMKVKAKAGKGSFRKATTLHNFLIEAKAQVNALKEEMASNPSECSNRVGAAKKKVAEERVLTIQRSLDELKKHQKDQEEMYKRERKKLPEDKKKALRISTTDPEARKMKMNNGGYSPAYNVQLLTDHKKRAIVGVKVINNASDYGQLSPMLEQISKRYGREPEEALLDAGYFAHKDIEAATRDYKSCTLYIAPRNANSYETTKGKSQAIIDLEKRMRTEYAQRIYKERSSTAEWVNAMNRNRGMKQFFVRGLKKVQSVVCLYAITHNMLIAYFN